MASDSDTPKPTDSNPIQSKIDSCIVQHTALRYGLDDIVGLEGAKILLEENFLHPLQFPQMFSSHVLMQEQPKSILLFGEPGCGKTMFGEAIARELGATFYRVCPSVITSAFHGEGEATLRQLFARAKSDARPSVIFFDEIDALLSKRGGAREEGCERKIKVQFLMELNELQSKDGVYVVGATNRPQDLEPATLRRFDLRLNVPLPCSSTRRALIEHLLRVTAHKLQPSHIQQFVEDTEGQSCDSIRKILQQSFRFAITREIRKAQLSQKPLPPVLTFDDVTLISSAYPRPLKNAEDELACEEFDKNYAHKPSPRHHKLKHTWSVSPKQPSKKRRRARKQAKPSNDPPKKRQQRVLVQSGDQPKKRRTNMTKKQREELEKELLSYEGWKKDVRDPIKPNGRKQTLYVHGPFETRFVKKALEKAQSLKESLVTKSVAL